MTYKELIGKPVWWIEYYPALQIKKSEIQEIRIDGGERIVTHNSEFVSVRNALFSAREAYTKLAEIYQNLAESYQERAEKARKQAEKEAE